MSKSPTTEIVLRHQLTRLICTVSYFAPLDSFRIEDVRFADPLRADRPDDSIKEDLHRRINFTEPQLRADLLDALVPGAEAQAIELREEALRDRWNNLGVGAGFVAYVVTGYVIYEVYLWLLRHVGEALSTMFIFLLGLPLTVVVMPSIERRVVKWCTRRHCDRKGHRSELAYRTVRCKRCGLSINIPD